MKLNKSNTVEKEDILVVYTEITNGKGKVYNQRFEILEKEMIKWSCDCVFGSAFRFSKKHIKRGTLCRHAKFAIKGLKRRGLLK